MILSKKEIEYYNSLEPTEVWFLDYIQWKRYDSNDFPDLEKDGLRYIDIDANDLNNVVEEYW